MRDMPMVAKALIYPLAKMKTKEEHMVIDYLNKEHALSCGMEDLDENDQIYFRNEEGFSNVTFINFPLCTYGHISFSKTSS